MITKIFVILFILWFVGFLGRSEAKTPAIYHHTGKIVMYIDPATPDVVQSAYVLDDHTQIDAYSGDTAVDPLQSLITHDHHTPDDFQGGPNGLKFFVVGEFKYRENLRGTEPTICVAINHPAPQTPVEACYGAFPRDPSVLEAR